MDTLRIGSPRDMAGGYRPALLQRHDEDFIAATLDDLRSEAGRRGLQGMAAKARDARHVLKLFQPIQRQFHLAVIEAWCDGPGAPRIDPTRVVSAGMVLRRLGSQGREGWMRSNGRLRGWVPLSRIGGELLDPAPGNRLQRRLTGVADLDVAFTAQTRENPDHLLEENVIPLYLAPPDVCNEAGKTLYYGIVPTASSELSETPAELTAPGDDFGPASDAFRKHLPGPLRGESLTLPFPGEKLVIGWYDACEMPGDSAPKGVTESQWKELAAPGSTATATLRELIRMLRQLGGEFDAFGSGKEAVALRKVLHDIHLPLKTRPGDSVRRHIAADDFLRQASDILLARDSRVTAPEMPTHWPDLDKPQVDRLCTALSASLRARSQGGRSGRYDEPGARYVVRTFLRIKCPQGGPPKMIWSEETEPFVIAPWYEGDGAPPVQILLPDPSDRDLLKSLKPNVSFVVPPALQNLLSGKAKDLLAGKGSVAGSGLAWICSFNIPILTLCAFLVLNIFLSLFNLIFGWMFFIKLCLPFPKLGDKPPKSP